MAQSKLWWAKNIIDRNVIPEGEASVNAMFYGGLKVAIRSSNGPDSYTFQPKPGMATIVLSPATAAAAATSAPNSPTAPTPKEMRWMKAAALGLLYHEIGHLKCTDMTGKPFQDAAKDLEQLASRIKAPAEAISSSAQTFANICEDPAEERLMSNHRLYSFTGKYFRFLRKRIFVPMAAKYQDDGDIDSLFNYILLYYRVGPAAISGKNAIFEKLSQKGLRKKLAEVYKEENAYARARKQIDLYIWIIDNSGLKEKQACASQPQTPDRPIIILVDPDPNGKHQKSVLQPEIGNLPPVSVVQAQSGGSQEKNDDSDQNPIIIDQRKNKPSGEEGEEKGNGEGSEQGSSEEAEGNEGKEGGKDGENDSSSSSSSSSSAGKEKGGLKAGGDEGGEEEDIFSIGSEDADEIGDDFGDAYDASLDQTVAMLNESRGKGWVEARRAVQVIDDSPVSLFDSFASQNSGLAVALASSLRELKDASAPEVISRLSSGSDVNLDDYIDIEATDSPSISFFQEEIPGREITDLAVSILVDCSGSMMGDSCRTATAACSLICLGCEAADVPSEVTAYSSGDVVWIKRFEDDVATAKPYFGLLDNSCSHSYRDADNLIHLWGGTTTEDAAALVIQSLRGYEGKACKLLFVITDGYTSNIDRMKEVVSAARKDGIVVIGIGIGVGRDALERNFGKCASFDRSSLGSLPEYVATQIREAMATPDFQNR